MRAHLLLIVGLLLCFTAHEASAAAQCGNGLQEESEACDDGNTIAGDGCSPSCQCESAPCSFTANPQVNLVSVISRMRPGATLTLAAGRYSGSGSCGWNMQGGNGGVGNASVVDRRPITVRSGDPSAPAVLIDCEAFGPVVSGIVNGPTYLRLVGIHFTNAQRRGGQGGALLRAEGGSRIDVDSCKVTDCGSDGEGGAIFASDSDLDISGSHFEYLRSESSGGGLALVDRSRATLTRSTFTHCSAGNHGGAVFVSNASSSVMDRMIFSYNEAAGPQETAGRFLPVNPPKHYVMRIKGPLK